MFVYRVVVVVLVVVVVVVRRDACDTTPLE